jgi:hypothetical protein
MSFARPTEQFSLLFGAMTKRKKGHVAPFTVQRGLFVKGNYLSGFLAIGVSSYRAFEILGVALCVSADQRDEEIIRGSLQLVCRR